jgi:hypothetical protein
MPDDQWQLRTRRVEIALGLLLAAVSFAPWWTRRGDGSGASAWSGPHLSGLAVLLCLAVVAARVLPRPGLGDRWAAAGIVVALAVTGWGWFSELARPGMSPADGSAQMAWVLQEQGATAGPLGGRFDPAWGYPAGLGLMALLLAAVAVTARLRRDR